MALMILKILIAMPLIVIFSRKNNQESFIKMKFNKNFKIYKSKSMQ